MQETELINRLKKLENSAFALLLDEYQTIILNCCFKFVKNRETAEDLTQEVFIEVIRSINSFRGDSKLSTWLYRIAISKSFDYLKSMKRKKRIDLLKRVFSDMGKEKYSLTENNPTPQQSLENEERIKVLSMAIDSLPENQKAAFTLHKYSEISYSEIAEILRTSVSSVESLIFRAKGNLKKKLYNYYKNNL